MILEISYISRHQIFMTAFMLFSTVRRLSIVDDLIVKSSRITCFRFSRNKKLSFLFRFYSSEMNQSLHDFQVKYEQLQLESKESHIKYEIISYLTFF